MKSKTMFSLKKYEYTKLVSSKTKSIFCGVSSISWCYCCVLTNVVISHYKEISSYFYIKLPLFNGILVKISMS